MVSAYTFFIIHKTLITVYIEIYVIDYLSCKFNLDYLSDNSILCLWHVGISRGTWIVYCVSFLWSIKVKQIVFFLIIQKEFLVLNIKSSQCSNFIVIYNLLLLICLTSDKTKYHSSDATVWSLFLYLVQIKSGVAKHPIKASIKYTFQLLLHIYLY